MTLIPRDNRKSFWSETAAKRFYSQLNKDGYEADISGAYDIMNKCHVFIVAWDNK